MKIKTLGTQQKYYKGSNWKLALRKDDRKINDLIDEYSDVKIRKDWEVAKIFVMIKVLTFKFQDEELKKKITSIPDNAVFVEYSTNTTWGCGIYGLGNNYLGKILTVLSWVLKYGSCKNMPENIKELVRIKKFW